MSASTSSASPTSSCNRCSSAGACRGSICHRLRLLRADRPFRPRRLVAQRSVARRTNCRSARPSTPRPRANLVRVGAHQLPSGAAQARRRHHARRDPADPGRRRQDDRPHRRRRRRRLRLWQVSDDSGADLPPIVRGARDRTYGIGGEIDVTIAEAHSRVIVRYAHDVGARSRPEGQILVFEIQWSPWSAPSDRELKLQRQDVQPAR